MRLIIVVLFGIIISTIMPDNVTTRNLYPEKQEQTPLFSFGLISDIQYCDCDPVGTRFYRSSLLKLEDAMKYFRKRKPEFIIDLGDMIEKDFVSYKPVFNILDTSGFKIYHATGNHDYSVAPRFKNRLPPLKFNKEGYFSFINGKFRFIILNGNDVSTYSTNNKSVIKEANDYILKLKNSGELNGLEWNGGISSKQIVWLTNQLNTAARNGEKVFIICHFPVYPVNIHNLLNYKDILKVLDGYNNIIAWFNGHNHQGNYGNFHMVHFVTMKGMVETEYSNSFALVEVYKNKIWIKGSGREKSQILAY